MKYTDLEIISTDLFEYTGLSGTSMEDRAEYSLVFDSLMGLAAICSAATHLSESDAGIAMGLLEREEPERLQAFMASRGIDVQELAVAEVLRVKRAIIESGRRFATIDDLDVAIKALLPPELSAVGMADVEKAEAEMDAFVDTLPTTEEKKSSLKAAMRNAIEGEAMRRVEAKVPPQIFSRVCEMFDHDDVDKAITLLLEHGIDMVRLQADVTRDELRSLQQEIGRR